MGVSPDAKLVCINITSWCYFSIAGMDGQQYEDKKNIINDKNITMNIYFALVIFIIVFKDGANVVRGGWSTSSSAKVRNIPAWRPWITLENLHSALQTPGIFEWGRIRLKTKEQDSDKRRTRMKAMLVDEQRNLIFWPICAVSAPSISEKHF